MTTQDSRDSDQKSEMPKEHKADLPSERPGRDIDMACAVLFCASCQYLNGEFFTRMFTVLANNL